MLEILKLFNYTTPNFYVTNEKPFGPPNEKIKFEIRKTNNTYFLYINGQQWMMYEMDNHYQASQVFSHFFIADGDVITTGLGLGVREKWLLNNNKVKKLTIIEKNKELIELHKEINPELFEKSKIINCDIREYKGECDTLLLDHYEWESMDYIIEDVKNICNNNIKCKKMWFWHLETKILADTHNYKNVDNICDDFRKGIFKINTYLFDNIKNIYDKIKIDNNLIKLPNLSKEELLLILSIYTHFFQKL